MSLEYVYWLCVLYGTWILQGQPGMMGGAGVGMQPMYGAAPAMVNPNAMFSQQQQQQQQPQQQNGQNIQDPFGAL